ncbi:MAG: hypothetical protein IJ184_05955 [Alphaproteobacteria bacterium]|nr:hypothetical protein [Alphaproteobacteria bacterium]
MSSKATIIAQVVAKQRIENDALFNLQILQIEYNYKSIPLPNCAKFAPVKLKLGLNDDASYPQGKDMIMSKVEYEFYSAGSFVEIEMQLVRGGAEGFSVSSMRLLSPCHPRGFARLSDMVGRLDIEFTGR